MTQQTPAERLEPVLHNLTSLLKDIEQLKNMDWKLLNSRPIFDIGLEISKWEPFSEISHVSVSDINFSSNTTQKGIDLLDDP